MLSMKVKRGWYDNASNLIAFKLINIPILAQMLMQARTQNRIHMYINLVVEMMIEEALFTRCIDSKYFQAVEYKWYTSQAK